MPNMPNLIDYDAVVARLAKKIKDERDQKVSFIHTARFGELMAVFQEAVACGKEINGEHVKNNEGDYPFTADEFRMAIETVFQNHEPQDITRDGEQFTSLATNFQGLGFSVLIGQGSIYVVGAPVRYITASLDFNH